MNLWRLELARLLRTHRWMILAGVFAFFAVSGPLLLAFLDEFLALFGDELVIEVPEQRPVDGIMQYVEGVSQLGMLAVVIVAAAALTLDARPEVAAFLRARVSRPHQLVLPRYAVVTLAAIAALIAGMAVAWAITAALIGGLPVGPMLLGTLGGMLYLAFAVAVVAAVAGFTRGMVGTILASVAVLLLFPLLGMIGPVRPWLPSSLLSAVYPLAEGAAVTELLPAVLVTIVATPVLLVLATHRLARREL